MKYLKNNFDYFGQCKVKNKTIFFWQKSKDNMILAMGYSFVVFLVNKINYYV